MPRGAAIRSNRAQAGPAQHRCQLCSSPGVEKVKTAVMGSCKSSLNGLDKLREASQPLCFHPTTKGSQIQLDAAHCIASRADTFCNGIVFSNRPVQLGEKVVLRVLCTQPHWKGGLRVGFTSLDPSQMISKDLPRFACPSLVLQGRTWASLLPNAREEQGTIVRFWLDRKGRVFFSINNKHHRLLLKGVPCQGPLWAVIDVYGQTKAVQLLDQYGDLQELPPELPCSFLLNEPAHGDPCHLPRSSMEKCIICCAHVANTRLYPCRHTNCCHCCVWRMLDTDNRCPICRQDIKDVVRFSLRTDLQAPIL